ncbi:uncharacterized protein EV420DRAFT_1623116 [Desarmillaria tabescens]|uniref:Uncharacterized protein n=1 Tax=Armillaria tabescens TaxID=1929756 RepID=A0AA39JCY7_ARMTA|nr:uncharacterized protein EV420DRAFT_1623116 [Desarmillaria tabescens]KAK0440482.1 hypothetical protein EV420DRAFT_1623116 [Desarmillaria tabescens]
MAHLCPARAIATWIGTSKITHGYLFPHIDKSCTHLEHCQKPDVFLELFRNNLWDLGISPYVYGTHSFQCGGCQWLSCDLRWSIRQICEWGGWSSDFTHLTIVKYLISSNDNPMLRCEDFFRLDCQVAKCWTCG